MAHALPRLPMHRHAARHYWTWWQKLLGAAGALFVVFAVCGIIGNAVKSTPAVQAHHAAAVWHPPPVAPGAADMMPVSDSIALAMLSVQEKSGPLLPFVWSGGAYVPADSIRPGVQYYAGPLEWNWVLGR